jgi:hypothetical protein
VETRGGEGASMVVEAGASQVLAGIGTNHSDSV